MKAIQKLKNWLKRNKSDMKYYSDKMLIGKILDKIDEFENGEKLEEGYNDKVIPAYVDGVSTVINEKERDDYMKQKEVILPTVENYTAMKYPTSQPGITTSDTRDMQIDNLTKFCQSVRELLIREKN